MLGERQICWNISEVSGGNSCIVLHIVVLASLHLNDRLNNYTTSLRNITTFAMVSAEPTVTMSPIKNCIVYCGSESLGCDIGSSCHLFASYISLYMCIV